MSLEAFPVDLQLPQLSTATDPAFMRQVFRDHLCQVSSRTYHIQDCLLSWVRYFRGTRCTLQYTLRLVDPQTGHKRNQWVTGAIYPEGQAERVWQKLQTADPRQEIPEAFQTFEPVSFIPDLNMVVQVFPYDRRLPALPFLLAATPLDLGSLIFTPCWPGECHENVWSIEPIWYRAGARAVLRYEMGTQDAATGKRGKRCFYVKVYRGEEGEHTYQTLQTLWAGAEFGREGFTVGRPMAYLRDLNALVQEEVTGTSLQELLLQGRHTVAVVRKVAQALAAFNQNAVVPTRRHSQEDEISGLKSEGNILRSACPQEAVEVDRIIGAIAARLEKVPYGPTHGDFKADHILLDGDRLALLDLDFFAEADPVLDPARILAHLAGLTFRSDFPDDGGCRAASRAFAEEYFVHVPGAWRGRLPHHYAGALLKEAVAIFRRQEARWPDTISAMVKEARASLANRIW